MLCVALFPTMLCVALFPTLLCVALFPTLCCCVVVVVVVVVVVGGGGGGGEERRRRRRRSGRCRNKNKNPTTQCGEQKLHAAVARSTFSSENVQNMSAPDHFLKLRC